MIIAQLASVPVAIICVILTLWYLLEVGEKSKLRCKKNMLHYERKNYEKIIEFINKRNDQ